MIEKVIAGFILGTQVVIFAMFPYYYSKISNQKMIKIFDSFSGGLFLGIAFLHILPEANESISNFFNGQKMHQHSNSHEHQLQYGSLIAILTFLLVLTLQIYMQGHHHHSHEDHHHIHQQSKQKKQISTDIKQKKQQITIGSYLIQIAIGTHSFFQSMTLGVENDNKIILTLTILIILHKWVEALTLGFSFKKADIAKNVALKFALLHAFINFAAIIIGYQMSSSNQLIKGIIYSISAGTFLFISIIQKIYKEFQTKDQLFKKFVLVCSGLLFCILILD